MHDYLTKLPLHITFSCLQTLAPHSSILSVTIVTVDSRASSAVSEFGFSSSAVNSLKVNWASASTKMGITESDCIC